MSSPIERRRLLLGGAALGALPVVTAGRAAAQPAAYVLEIKTSETATIDGRDWDRPMPGGVTVDAVHRSVLLRFPTAGDEIADFLRGGHVLVGAELVMLYAGYEIVPQRYTFRDGLGRKIWTENPPTWHVQAFPLRQSWAADADTGPTYNASVAGVRYWKRFGAADPQGDRFVDLLEPKELSNDRPEARIDILKLLSTPVFEHDPGERLRGLENRGFLLRKLETYDTRYRSPGDAYEWAMPTGGHGLKFDAPKLVLTARRTTSQVSVAMPMRAPQDWKSRAKDGSRPTADLPSLQKVMESIKRAIVLYGEGRTPREAGRVAELLRVGGDRLVNWITYRDEKGYKEYAANVVSSLEIVPRYWLGWEVQDLLLLPLTLPEILPAPLMEHLKNYWRAWLQPELPTNAFVNPQSPEALEYWKQTRDWRGRASFFRDGYNYAVSTQNFNHTAAMGALLGGALIGSPYAIGDGRHGLEHLALRFWSFADGGTQELLDHYYLSITLSAQKMFADFGPAAIDRLMGRVLVDRTMELLTTAYHSRTRRFVSSSGRARLSGVLVEQDGIYGALHTLSKDGVLTYADQRAGSFVKGMPVWGYDFPPGRVAIQSIQSAWGPAWMSGLIDDKPVPFEHTSTETTRGNFKPPLWRRSWLGRWHGLASSDIKGGTVDVMAQWVRAPKKAARIEDLGTLTVRYHANTPDLASTSEGIHAAAGLTLTYQSRNRAIVFAKPHTNRERFFRGIRGGDLARLATVVGLWNFNATPDWELFVDGRKIDAFPYRMTTRQRLLIRDGVTYLAILPLPASDLGRDAEIEIGPGGGGRGDFSRENIAPALIVSMFNMKRDTGLAARDIDLDKITTQTYGGFVLEMGDAEQHGSFQAFAEHIAKCELKADWQEGEKRLDVAYRSGEDLMEAGFGTSFGQPGDTNFAVNPGAQEKAIPYRKLNGQWPYLPPGLERDTSWSQQGTTGRLEKNGAVLLTEPGRKAYLLADPLSGAVVGYNPLPDPQTWKLSTRDGAVFAADGKLGLLRVEYRPAAREVEIAYALKPEQNDHAMARYFTIDGLDEPPRITLNDRPVEPARDGKTFRIAL
jgi:hypothetical protein